MTTVNEIEGHDIVFVKGAVDVLLKNAPAWPIRPPARDRVSRPGDRGSRSEAGESGQRPEAAIPCRTLSSSDRQRILDQNSRWSARGLRVLAFACRPFNEGRERSTVIPA